MKREGRKRGREERWEGGKGEIDVSKLITCCKGWEKEDDEDDEVKSWVSFYPVWHH